MSQLVDQMRASKPSGAKGHWRHAKSTTQTSLLLCVTIPGLDNLFAVSQVFEILAHGFCLLSLKLNGYLVTAAAATFHNHYPA